MDRLVPKMNRLTSAECAAFDSTFELFCRTGEWTLDWAVEQELMEAAGLIISSPSWEL